MDLFYHKFEAIIRPIMQEDDNSISRSRSFWPDDEDEDRRDLMISQAFATAELYGLMGLDAGQFLRGSDLVKYQVYWSLSDREKERLGEANVSKYMFLKVMGLAPNLELRDAELEESMDVMAKDWVRQNLGVDTTLPIEKMWGFLDLSLSQENQKRIFQLAEAKTHHKEKNFPLGTIYKEVSVTGLREKLEPIEATKLLIAGLIGRKRDNVSAAQQVFDKEKLQRARQWIKTSDLKPEKIFRDISAHLKRTDLMAVRAILSYLAVIPNQDINELVAGVLGLFEGKSEFSSILLKMQDGGFADLFDNRLLMSCTFFPGGLHSTAALIYDSDPDIGLFHVVPKIVGEVLPPIGVAILVNATDAEGNRWLVVDSVEGGLDLERIRENLWIPDLYNGILDLGKDIGAKYVLFNDKVIGGRPKKFLEYVSKINTKGERYLSKSGKKDFSDLHIVQKDMNAALETWHGEMEGAASGYIAELDDKNFIQVREINWERDKEALLAIENAAFDPVLQANEQQLRSQVERGFGIIITNKLRPLAYMVAAPMGNSTIYMDSIAVVPDAKSTTFRLLAGNLIALCKEKGINKVTGHAEADSPWYKFLLSHGGKELGSISNWRGTGKTFAYLEFDINRVTRNNPPTSSYPGSE